MLTCYQNKTLFSQPLLGLMLIGALLYPLSACSNSGGKPTGGNKWDNINYQRARQQYRDYESDYQLPSGVESCIDDDVAC